MPIVNPGPWVDREATQERPWESHSGIVKLMEFPRRRSDMSPRAFHLYWQRHHSPHVMNLTPFAQFIRKYSTTHVLEDATFAPPEGISIRNCDGVGEVSLNHLSELPSWFEQDSYGEIIASDEAMFLAQGDAPAVVVTKEQLLYDSDPDLTETSGIKVFLVALGREDVDYSLCQRQLDEFGRELASALTPSASIRRLAISHRLQEPFPFEWQSADIDAVIELWFGELSGAQEFLAASFLHDLYSAATERQGSALPMELIVGRTLVIHDEFSFQPTTTQPAPFG